MKPHLILLAICLVVSTVCLCIGYLLNGYWQIFFTFPVLVLLWLLARNFSVFWSASIFLVLYVLLAAVGVIIDLSQFLMLIASATALASWELMLFTQQKFEKSLLKSNNLLEKSHLKSLGLATLTGLVLALISSNISLELPFVVISILAFLLFGGLLYGLRFLVNDRS